MSDEAKVVWSDTRIQKYLGQYYDVTIVRDAVRSAMWMLRDDYETELAAERAKVASLEKQLNQTLESNDGLRSEFVRATIAKSQAEAELADLRAERDQWQSHAEGAVYALMLTEPHMLAGNLTEWIANCAQALEAQGRRLAELEAIKAAQDVEIAENNASFSLRWDADMRAIRKWKTQTGKALKWPDHSDLCVWLLEKLERAVVWEPVPDGKLQWSEQEAYRVEGDVLEVFVRPIKDSIVFGVESVEVNLPDNVRLCRRITQEGVDDATTD